MTVTYRVEALVVALLCAAPAAAGTRTAGVLPMPVALQGAADARGEDQQTWSRVFKTGPQGALELWNLAGDIHITGTTGDEIRVEAVKRLNRRHGGDARSQLDRVEITASESAGRVRIRTVVPETRNVAVDVQYTIRVPVATAVSVQAISGDIRLEKVTGETRAESISGDVTIEGARRLVRAKTVSGSILVTDASGDALDASSVSGDVQLRSLKARGCTLQTVSGTVSVHDAVCERAELRSVSGDVEYGGRLAPSGRYDFNSHSGDIRLALGSGAGFSITASTFSGDISSQLALANVTESEPPRHGPRNRRLQGTFGDGSAQVEVTTFSGSILLSPAAGRK